MKTKNYLIAFMFVAAAIQPVSLAGQTLTRKEATVAKPAQSWTANKIGENGSNIINGVEFYSYTEECGSQKVKFLKVINKNDYVVKVSYQLNENKPVVNVIVPALYSLEGYCGASETNLANLAIIVSDIKSEEEKQKIKEYIKTHITVIKVN